MEGIIRLNKGNNKATIGEMKRDKILIWRGEGGREG
jgi:hypothetical protein